MAELSLKQITDRLNAEFTSETTRKLVFWYEKGGFLDNIDKIKLDNAKVYKLEQSKQFYTKYLERVDTTTNYLVYAPFPKPPVYENHLEDTMNALFQKILC